MEISIVSGCFSAAWRYFSYSYKVHVVSIVQSLEWSLAKLSFDDKSTSRAPLLLKPMRFLFPSLEIFVWVVSYSKISVSNLGVFSVSKQASDSMASLLLKPLLFLLNLGSASFIGVLSSWTISYANSSDMFDYCFLN